MTFIAPAGACASMVANYDKLLSKIKDDIELRSGAYDQALKEDEPRHSQAKRGRDGKLPQASAAGTASSFADAQGVLAMRHRVWLTQMGAICFGHACLVKIADGSNLPRVTCFASLYGDNGGDRQMIVRRKWCTGKYCSDSDHARPLAAAGKALRVSWLTYKPRPEITHLSYQWTLLSRDSSLLTLIFIPPNGDGQRGGGGGGSDGGRGGSAGVGAGAMVPYNDGSGSGKGSKGAKNGKGGNRGRGGGRN